MIDCIDNERTWKPQVYMPFTNRDKTMYRLITDVAQERTKIYVAIHCIWLYLQNLYQIGM